MTSTRLRTAINPSNRPRTSPAFAPPVMPLVEDVLLIAVGEEEDEDVVIYVGLELLWLAELDVCDDEAEVVLEDVDDVVVELEDVDVEDVVLALCVEVSCCWTDVCCCCCCC